MRGLTLLAELDDADLFEWCAISLEDESDHVCLAALRTIAHECEHADTDILEPFVDSGNIHVRGYALAALCRHVEQDVSRWFRRGLKDPSSHVRLQVTAMLDHLEPTVHHTVFEMALTDPNP